ncbi:MAG TPA: hypothetical protein VFB60_05380 [Ktedonobacteraceae bacterium]|nr:hypothetical protein [Ktedonobacteraceae bacterium]
MSRKEKAAAVSSLACIKDSKLPAQELEHCDCLPFSPLLYSMQQDGIADHEHMVPVSLTLNNRVRSAVRALFPRSTPLSLLLLHICQQEYAHEAALPERRRYHAPSGVLEQVLINVRRVIRVGDRHMIQESAGAIIIFPDVDRQGICSIVERVYNSIDLLQAETLIPPLTRETAIVLGIGSYPDAGISIEDLLYQTGRVVRRLTLRPIITFPPHEFPEQCQRFPVGEPEQAVAASPACPLMALPQELAQHLKCLIPYQLAHELQCVPVGQDQHTLTVAMAHPGNMASIRRLQGETGLNIFPVACRSEELAALLARQW